MTALLPYNLTADAVPEKRTPDEGNQPPSEQEAREWLEREARSVDRPSTSNVVEGSIRPEDECNGARGQSNGNPSCDSFNRAKNKKDKDKEKKKKKYTNVMKFDHSVVQFGNTYHINNIKMEGFPGDSNGPNKSKSKDDPSLPTNISDRVLRCTEPVSQNDCSIISELITCDWRMLGERLFFQKMDQLKDYIAHTEGQSKQATICSILNRWRQMNGTAATVQRLSKFLLQLGQVTAIVKLANRHNIK